MLLLCLLVGSVNGAWAADQTGTITFGTNDVKINAASVNGNDDRGNSWTITTVGTTSYTPNAAYCQVGSSNKPATSITFTTTLPAEKTITAFSAKFGGFNGTAGTVTLKVGDTSVGTGSLNAANDVTVSSTSSAKGTVLTVTVTGISKGVKCYYITYTYTDGPVKTKIATIADIDDTQLDFNATGTFARPTITPATGAKEGDDYEVEWSSADANMLTLDAKTGEYLVGDTKGTVEVTLTVEPYDDAVYEAASKTFTVTIVDPNAPGTKNNPYTVAQARAAIDAGTGLTDVYAKGIVSEIVTAYNSQYGNISYNISADGLTTSDQLQAYRGKAQNGANFSSADDIQVGDEVVVFGNLKKHNSTYEFDQDNQLVSLKRTTKTDPELAFDVTSVNVNLGDAFVAPDLTNPYHVTVAYSSDDTNVATVDPSTGEVTILAKGEATITASFAGDETYKVGSASYTITVIDPNEKGTVTNPYTVAEVINGTATGNGIYVKGFIVGCYKNNSFTNSDLSVDSNLALADDADETTNVIPVELPKGDRRTAFNVEAHPYNVGVAQILYKGNADTYFGENGVKGSQVGTKKIAEKIDISAAGMATYYTDCALDFTGLTDMYAYIVTAGGGSNYSLTRVNKVPANTGLLLYNPNGGVASNVVPVLTEGAENVDGSILTGTLEKITAGTNDYILNNGAEGVGFYKGNGKDIDMHRAYLTVAASARPFFLINFDSEATGISFVGREASMNNRFFNLKGQQVKTPQKGLYIVNGKKVIIK